eukprot:TRINITY_DN6116_c0_g1_i1.p1 TRINITY_DN6116_c0_g1~~TRINITY_DN6116_c0_g1_i1.p1  ORF type:complete len:1436 (-),score=284.82 TRINITY_DN6116_c0_g1_i1:461-4768(-)
MMDMLYLQGVEEKDDKLSHFQYSLENSTDVNIFYGQTGASETKCLPPGQTASFSFTNPFQAKLLEFKLEGWEKADGQFSLDDPGVKLIPMQLENYQRKDKEIRRSIFLHVKPKGLKRRVQFVTPHKVKNTTDQPLKLVAVMDDPEQAQVMPMRTYHIPPGSKGTPISANGAWDMSFQVKFTDGEEWEFSEPIRLRRKDYIQRLVLKSSDGSRMRVMYISRQKDEHDVTNIIFSPPFVLINLTVFPMDYSFPNQAIPPGKIMGNSVQPFYIDVGSGSVVRLSLEGWRPSQQLISIDLVKHSTIELIKDSGYDEEEKNSVHLNVFNKATLLGTKGRIMYINTQYLFINDTDLVLFVKQRANTKTGSLVTLHPKSRTPFSWFPVGARQIHIKVGDTEWSQPLNVSKPGSTRLSITMPELPMNLSYDLLMEVKQADAFSRIVVIKPWLHVTNYCPHDLLLALTTGTNEQRKTAKELSLDPMSRVCKKKSRTDSAVCPQSLTVSIPSTRRNDYHSINFDIREPASYTLKIEETSNPKTYFALDVDVTMDSHGCYVQIRPNTSPPFIISNDTNYLLKLKPVYPAGHLGSFSTLTEIIVPPRETVEYFDDSLNRNAVNKIGSNEDNQIQTVQQFQASICFSEPGVRETTSTDGLNVSAETKRNTLTSSAPSTKKADKTEDVSAVAKRLLDGKGKKKEKEKKQPGLTLLTSDDDTGSTSLFTAQDHSSDEESDESDIVFKEEVLVRKPVFRTPLPSHDEVTPSAIFSPRFLNKRSREESLFNSLFSPSRHTWSSTFAVNKLGDQSVGFRVHHNEEGLMGLHRNNRTPRGAGTGLNDDADLENSSHERIEETEPDSGSTKNTLMLHVGHHGKTKRLTFSLPDASVNKASKKSGNDVNVIIRVPQLELGLLGENENELIYTTIKGIQLNFCVLSNYDRYIYFIVRDIEIDTMINGCEYPVLLLVDRKKLLNYEANMMEMLVQWSTKKNLTLVDFFGFRLLPIIFRLDGDSLSVLFHLSSLVSTTANEEEEEEETTQQQKRIEQYAKLTVLEKDEVEDDVSQEFALSVQRMHIFPLEIKLSIGRNQFFFPILTDAVIALRPFERVAMAGTMSSMVAAVTTAYMAQAWSELYKIIGDLDLLTSPMQNGKKLLQGARDFFTMPIESLVLDDTPGAFIIGLIRGSQSLLLNSTDFTLTLFMKLMNLFSFIIHFPMDQEYKDTKSRVIAHHPYNIFQGLKQGFFELGRGIWCGISGLVTCPWAGAKDGPFGLLLGLGHGLIGLPLKPLGGIFEFLRILLESGLNNLGRGHVMYTSGHTKKEKVSGWELEAMRITLQEIVLQSGVVEEHVRIVFPDSRIKERYLVLTKNYLVLFTLRKLINDYYKPKIVPLKNISAVLRPVHETNFVVALKQPMFGMHKIQFIAPDRNRFISVMEEQNIPISDVTKLEKID